MNSPSSPRLPRLDGMAQGVGYESFAEFRHTLGLDDSDWRAVEVVLEDMVRGVNEARQIQPPIPSLPSRAGSGPMVSDLGVVMAKTPTASARPSFSVSSTARNPS